MQLEVAAPRPTPVHLPQPDTDRRRRHLEAVKNKLASQQHVGTDVEVNGAMYRVSFLFDPWEDVLTSAIFRVKDNAFIVYAPDTITECRAKALISAWPDCPGAIESGVI